MLNSLKIELGIQTRLSNEWLVTLLVMSVDRLGQIGSVTAPLGMVAPTPAFGVI